MADDPAQDTGRETDTLIDEVIRAILNEAAGSSEAGARGKASATSLLETAALASTLTSSRTPVLERALIAEALGAAMAEALAPALADQLAPRLMKYLEESMASQPSGKGQSRAGGTSGSGRKSETGNRS
jgi:hypothetical protein